MSQDMNVSENSQIPPQFRSNALVAAGSNTPFGDFSPSSTIDRALKQLCDKAGEIRAVSRYFSTSAFPAGSGPDFVNAAFIWSTNLDPAEILEALHAVEADLGRVRRDRWGPRTLDLDLICVDDAVLPDKTTLSEWIDLPLTDQLKKTPPELLLPHPRLQDRAFVLVPLKEIAPNWRHPVLNLTIEQMHDALPQDAIDAVIPLETAGKRS